MIFVPPLGINLTLVTLARAPVLISTNIIPGAIKPAYDGWSSEARAKQSTFNVVDAVL